MLESLFLHCVLLILPGLLIKGLDRSRTSHAFVVQDRFHVPFPARESGSGNVLRVLENTFLIVANGLGDIFNAELGV